MAYGPLTKLRVGVPLWLDRSSARRRRYPALKSLLEVDVAIVGGGITGALVAYLFSEAGVRVAIVEANRCGAGSTAASTALLMQEPDRDFRDLARRYGPRKAQRIFKVLALGTRDLATTIKKLRFDCDLAARHSVYFTRDPEKLAHLEREFRDRKRAGLPGKWLSAANLQRVTGITGRGGIVTPGNAEVDPLKACHGFLRAASQRGAAIFERSPVKKITTSGSIVTVRTSGGAIMASDVVIATGYATPEFKPLLGRFRMKDTFVIATRRLPARLRRGAMRMRTMAWDTDRPYHYLRWTHDHRLLVGGEDVRHKTARGREGRLGKGRERLLAFLSEVHPALAGESPEYAWEGLFAETPDGLPYVGRHRRYPRHFFALGYGGNGMTASFLAARYLLKRYLKSPSADESLFAFGRLRKP